MNDFEQLDALRQTRMTQQTPGADATVAQHASIDTIRFLQARIRELRTENERLHDAIDTLQNAGLSMIIKDYEDRLYTASIYGEYRETLSEERLLAIINGLQCVQALAALDADAGEG